jgi:hypothetical protein
VIGVGDIVCVDGDLLGTAMGLGLVTRVCESRFSNSCTRFVDVLWASGEMFKDVDMNVLLLVHSAGSP